MKNFGISPEKKTMGRRTLAVVAHFDQTDEDFDQQSTLRFLAKNCWDSKIPSKKFVGKALRQLGRHRANHRNSTCSQPFLSNIAIKEVNHEDL